MLWELCCLLQVSKTVDLWGGRGSIYIYIYIYIYWGTLIPCYSASEFEHVGILDQMCPNLADDDKLGCSPPSVWGC